jgi:serralysin
VAQPFNPVEGVDWGTKLPGYWITYHFADPVDDDMAPTEQLHGIQFSPETWNGYEKAQAALAFKTFSDITNLQFAEASSDASILVLAQGTFLTQPRILGAFGAPGTGETAGQGVFNTAQPEWSDTAGQALEQGGYGFDTLIHELGHGLGLAHPHDTGGGNSPIFPGVTDPFDSSGLFDLKQSIYTMMSYVDGWAKAPEGISTDRSYGWVGTPMAFDIAALQQKYGANMEHRTGDDTYLLPDVNASGTFYACIWDAGGNDTMAYAGIRDATIDLRPASLEFAVGGGGYMSHALGVFGGFTIAHGVVIENATGGAGNDTLTGNHADNHLQGGAGDDVLTGLGGNNRLDGGAGTDTAGYTQSRAGYSVDFIDGQFQVRALTGNSADTLTDIELLQFTEGTLLTRAATDDGLSVGGLYHGLLGRSVEADGFRFWTDIADSADIGGVARGILGSNEFSQGLGSTSAREFVSTLYGNLLGRSAEATGLQFWIDVLDGGLDRSAAALSFIASTEYREQHFGGLFTDLAALGDVWAAA